MERKNNLLIGFNFLFEEFFVSFFLSSNIKTLRVFINRFITIPGYESKFRARSNHVPNGK